MKVDEKHVDLITELVNIGMGRCADILNEMLESHINLNVPEFMITDASKIKQELNLLNDSFFAAVDMNFNNDINGTAQLVFPSASAVELVNVFAGKLDEEDCLDELRISALTEIGNIIINTIIGTISNYLKTDLTYSIPRYIEGDIDKILKTKLSPANDILLLCHTHFSTSSHKVSGNLLLYFEVENFGDFIFSLNRYYEKLKINAV